MTEFTTKDGRTATPVKYEGRICFSLAFFASEEDADIACRAVREMGCTYNGGWFHGMPCGREFRFDRTVDGVKVYAVSYV